MTTAGTIVNLTTGRPMAVFQCEVCTDDWRVGDKVFPTALTIAVDEDGQVYDPNTLAPAAGTPPSLN